MRLSIVLSFGACAAVALGQPGRVARPGLGYAWDSRSQEIRPIHGLPGAAVLGERLPLGSYTVAAISPRHDLALAVSADDSKVQLIRFSTGDKQEIPGLTAAPSRFVFSPSGSAAVAIGSRLQVVTGVADNPGVQDLITPADAGPPVAIALSDNAQQVLMSDTSGDTPALWLLSIGYSPVRLPLTTPIAAVGFRPGTTDAVAIGADGAVYSIRNSGIPGEVVHILDAQDKTAAPVAVSVSADGALAYSSNQAGTLAAIDLVNAAITTVQCGCAPTGMEKLAAPNLYRVNEISDGPLMLFDVSPPAPRVWFVPADAPAADSDRSAR